MARAYGLHPRLWLLADTKRYEGFRQVYEIHKYFDEISISAVCSACSTCHHCIGF